jgi:hypothetical protein
MILRCPDCGSLDVRQRWPSRLYERVARILFWRPFVCWDCMTRFHAFVLPLRRT